MTAVAAEPLGYYPPNFSAPLSFASYRGAAPAQATTKGFYFKSFLRELASYGHHLEGFGPYSDFRDYPLDEAAKLLHEASVRLYPDESAREGLRRLGWVVFPTLLSTMVGKVVFGALGNDVASVVRNAPKGFEVSMNVGSCEIVRAEPGEAEVSVREFYLFPECFLVGVFEGALAHYGVDVQVLMRQTGAFGVDLLLRWR